MFDSIYMDTFAVLLGGVGALLVSGTWIKLLPELARPDQLSPQFEPSKTA